MEIGSWQERESFLFYKFWRFSEERNESGLNTLFVHSIFLTDPNGAWGQGSFPGSVCHVRVRARGRRLFINLWVLTF